MRKLAVAVGTVAMGVVALLAAGQASAAPGEIGPFSSEWTCEQKAYEMMGSAAPYCVYRSDDSRGKGYYFKYTP